MIITRRDPTPPPPKKKIYIFTYIIIRSESPPSAASRSYQTYQTYQSAFDRTRRTDWRADRHTDKQPDLHIAYWTVISVTWHTCLHGGSARMNFSVIWWMGERTDVTHTQTYSHYMYIHTCDIDNLIERWNYSLMIALLICRYVINNIFQNFKWISVKMWKELTCLIFSLAGKTLFLIQGIS